MRHCALRRSFEHGRPAMTEQNIYLTGFMGAGKSTVGIALAKRLNYQFIDLDEHIEFVNRRSISDIFSSGGEEGFRCIETLELQKLCGLDRTVISTGGGAFCQDGNRELMLRTGLVVCIDAPLDLIRKRLSGDTERPLLQNQKAGDLYKLFMTRQPLYRKAHLIVNGRKSVLGIVNDILRYLIKTGT